MRSGFEPKPGNCVVCLGETVLSKCLSSPTCIKGTGEFNARGLPSSGLESFGRGGWGWGWEQKYS